MLRSFILAGALFAAATPAAAQSVDGLVKGIAGLARQNLGHSQPIVPAALDLQTVRRAALTAQLQACDGPWEERSYLPYMAQLRSSGRYSEQQLDDVGVLHGLAQQMVFENLSARSEPCPVNVRAALTKTFGR